MYYIAHYGVGHLRGGNSGRYKWGSGNRPMQSAKFNKPKSTQNRYSEKKKIIDSGDAKLIKKHSNELSNQELERAIKRMQLNKQLNKEIKDSSATTKMLKAVNAVAKTTITTAAVYKAYKTLKKAF